jgi:hypothetical protein
MNGLDATALDGFALRWARIGLGVWLLATVTARHRFLADFLAHVPAAFLNRPTAQAATLGLLSGYPPALHAMHAAGAVLAFALIGDWRPRWAAAGAWALLGTWRFVDPAFVDRGDQLAQLLCLYLALLPVRSRAAAGAAPVIRSPFAAALAAQAGLVYLFAGLQKTGIAWRRDFSALETIFRIPALATPLARVLAEHPMWLRPVTAAVPWLEVAVLPVLAGAFALHRWRPRLSRRLRCAVVIMMLTFHGAILLTLHLPMFATIGALLWLSLWPGREMSAPLPGPERASRGASALAVVLVAVAVATNVATMAYPASERAYPAWSAPLRASGLWQRWSMFSPEPQLSAEGHPGTVRRWIEIRAGAGANAGALLYSNESDLSTKLWGGFYRGWYFWPRLRSHFLPYVCSRYGRESGGQLVGVNRVTPLESAGEPGPLTESSHAIDCAHLGG